MTVYHTMNLMISFGLLVATVIAVSQKNSPLHYLGQVGKAISF